MHGAFHFQGVRVVVFNATFNNIFQLYHGGQFYWWKKPDCTEKTTDLSHLIFNLYGEKNDKIVTRTKAGPIPTLWAIFVQIEPTHYNDT